MYVPYLYIFNFHYVIDLQIVNNLITWVTRHSPPNIENKISNSIFNIILNKKDTRDEEKTKNAIRVRNH